MKKTFITIIALAAFTIAKAQQSTPKNGDPNVEITIDAPIKTDAPDTSSVNRSKIFTAVEMEPSFPGGVDRFYQFLQYNVKYPAEAVKYKVQGKVFISFVVERDGSLTDIKILRGIGSGCDEEAVRVVSISPKWKPGIQNGRPVRVQYTMPISFTLTGR
ncbi:MAG TPA: energy transducer TonB [Mucilaginibacter sp.]|jgi:protein TonB|nr:energy transducer TonB [Mucilaginibacter sp.]